MATSSFCEPPDYPRQYDGHRRPDVFVGRDVAPGQFRRQLERLGNQAGETDASGTGVFLQQYALSGNSGMAAANLVITATPVGDETSRQQSHGRQSAVRVRRRRRQWRLRRRLDRSGSTDPNPDASQGGTPSSPPPVPRTIRCPTPPDQSLPASRDGRDAPTARSSTGCPSSNARGVTSSRPWSGHESPLQRGIERARGRGWTDQRSESGQLESLQEWRAGARGDQSVTFQWNPLTGRYEADLTFRTAHSQGHQGNYVLTISNSIEDAQPTRWTRTMTGCWAWSQPRSVASHHPTTDGDNFSFTVGTGAGDGENPVNVYGYWPRRGVLLQTAGNRPVHGAIQSHRCRGRQR